MSSFLEAIFRKMQQIYVIMMTLSALVIACQSSDTRQKCLFPYKYDGVSSENNTSLARCEVLCQRHATCTHFNWICSDKRCAGSRDDPMRLRQLLSPNHPNVCRLGQVSGICGSDKKTFLQVSVYVFLPFITVSNR